jgi:hypothetical protein
VDVVKTPQLDSRELLKLAAEILARVSDIYT